MADVYLRDRRDVGSCCFCNRAYAAAYKGKPISNDVLVVRSSSPSGGVEARLCRDCAEDVVRAAHNYGVVLSLDRQRRA
jgi:hypothetical protein